MNTFIRRYYKNQLIRGSLYAIALLVTLFVCMSLSEHFGFFSPLVRAFLFWGYLLLVLAVVGYCVVRPWLHMHRLGRVLSYEQAAVIVGNHFPEVADQLLNLLQMERMAPTADSDLLMACIAQKTEHLSPIPFFKAVDLSKNRRYVKYAAIPLLALLVLLVLAPATIVSSSHRIVDYNTVYQRPAPFSFVVENATLETTAHVDFTLQVTTEGTSAPSEVYIQLAEGSYKMHDEGRGHFSHRFAKPVSDVEFRLSGGGVTSPTYQLRVHPEASVVDFSIALSYPAYTHRENEVLMNDGDMTVPRGTQVHWRFQTHDADSLILAVEGSAVRRLCPDASGRVMVTWRAMESSNYCFYVCNTHTLKADTLRYAVSVIPDAAPMINVTDAVDSTLPSRRLFYGRIKDDYGFSALNFVIERRAHDDTVAQELDRRPVALTQESAQEFFYSFDLSEIVVEMGDRISYYFEVCDNNGVDGPQCRRSQEFVDVVPTEKELRQQLDEHGRQAEQKAQLSLSELQKLQRDIESMLQQLVDKKELNWQDKQQLQELYERQKEVRDALQQMREEMRQGQQLQERFNNPSEELMEKQRELDRLMNEVLDDKMKQMMEEMERMMQQLDKKEIQSQLENIQLNSKDLEKQIDRDIELMKRLEMEKRVESVVEQMDELADRQEQLSKEVEKASKQESERLLQEQQELSKKYDELKEEIRAIEKDYKKLDESLNFKSDKQLEQSIDEHQRSAEQQLQRNSRKGASQHQRSAAEDMRKLSEQLAEMQQDLEQENLAEDAESIRRLLKNLIHLSYNQESLIGLTSSTFVQDPQYQRIISLQGAIKSDFRIVEDSLNAIARRQVQVAAAVTKEVSAANINAAKSLSDLMQMNQSFYGNSKNTAASRSMQYTMTSFNNLSLILAESLDQMNKEMAQNQKNKQKGSCKNAKQGKCSNPGQSKPSAKSLKQMQDELNKQMEALKKQLDKQGKNEGQGRKRLGQKDGMSEEFARMAAQQEAIRRMMQQYGQELKQENARDGKMAREIDDMLRQMEQTETDLVNKTISQQTLNRQEQIMSRMLEHEKAEMEREKEERRESHEATDVAHPTPQMLQQFEKLRRRNSSESLYDAPLPLTPFYKSKADDYLFR